MASRSIHREKYLCEDPQRNVGVVQSRPPVRVLRPKPYSTRAPEREAPVTASSADSWGNQNPFRRVKDPREDFGLHRGFNWHSAERAVRFEMGRFQFFSGNNERGAFNRSRFRGPVQNRILSEACTHPSTSSRSIGQVEITIVVLPAGRLGLR